jgi:hypothetical protein
MFSKEFKVNIKISKDNRINQKLRNPKVTKEIQSLLETTKVSFKNPKLK